MYKFMSEEYCEFVAWNKCSSYAAVVAAAFWIEPSFFILCTTTMINLSHLLYYFVYIYIPLRFI